MKNLWLVLVLVAAGVIIFSFSLGGKKGNDQPVVMQEVFNQTPAKSAAVASTDPVTSPAIVTSPENGHEAGFSIQVYSFQDRGRAEKALDNLHKAGYKAFLEVSDLGEKGIWNRVRVGGIADEAQARKMLEEIRKNYNSGFIVKPAK